VGQAKVDTEQNKGITLRQILPLERKLTAGQHVREWSWNAWIPNFLEACETPSVMPKIKIGHRGSTENLECHVRGAFVVRERERETAIARGPTHYISQTN